MARPARPRATTAATTILVCLVAAVVVGSAAGTPGTSSDPPTHRASRAPETTGFSGTATETPTSSVTEPATRAPVPPEAVEPVGHPPPTTTAPATTAPRTSVPATTAPPATSVPPVPGPASSPPVTDPQRAAAPATTVPHLTPSAPVGPLRWGLDPYRGLGTWLDVWDWSPTFTGGAAVFRLSDLDTMAARGVRTIYLQTARANRPEDVLDPALLAAIVEGAHTRGMRVVAWYLPTFEDPDTDLRRLVAAADLGVDGLAVDIESLAVPDPATRTARLLALSGALDAAVGGAPLGAITLPPVATEILNPAYWPGHPWRDLGRTYDVFLPMTYWGNRTEASGWHDGYRYTAENLDLVRTLVGRADLPVHPVGGIGTAITAADIEGMVRAARERRALGGSTYDWMTTPADHWAALAGFAGF